MLNISNLRVSIDQKPILKGLSLSLRQGELAVLMGPNGSGKSTLTQALAGHPSYLITEGSILLGEAIITEAAPEERAATGLFVAFQNPPSIPGVPVADFLRIAVSSLATARGNQPPDSGTFLRSLRDALGKVGLSLDFAERNLGEGFSGGEKKRLELLQALLLQPKVVVFDELDSGLDVDALKLVQEIITDLRAAGTTILYITHYPELVDQLQPDSVHILQDGVITRSGTGELGESIAKHGYR